jgi:hypothetical protein
MIKNKVLGVYATNSHKHYVIDYIGKCARIPARVREDNEQIIRRLLAEGATHIVFHIDLSDTQGFFQNKAELLERLELEGIQTVNALLSDIKKDTLQAHCAKAKINGVLEEMPDVPRVIIKSKLNFNGFTESKLNPEEKSKLGIPDNHQPKEYEIITKEKLKGRSIDDDMQAEQFIENRENLFYRAYKMFDRLVVSEVIDKNEIKKMPIGIKRKNFLYDLVEQSQEDRLHSIVSQISALSRSMNIDYAAFDIAVSDKPEYYIIDVNHTPFWGDTIGTAAESVELMNHLRGGIQ